jgi:hypothetical protein
VANTRRSMLHMQEHNSRANATIVVNMDIESETAGKRILPRKINIVVTIDKQTQIKQTSLSLKLQTLLMANEDIAN